MLPPSATDSWGGVKLILVVVWITLFLSCMLVSNLARSCFDSNILYVDVGMLWKSRFKPVKGFKGQFTPRVLPSKAHFSRFLQIHYTIHEEKSQNTNDSFSQMVTHDKITDNVLCQFISMLTLVFKMHLLSQALAAEARGRTVEVHLPKDLSFAMFQQCSAHLVMLRVSRGCRDGQLKKERGPCLRCEVGKLTRH